MPTPRRRMLFHGNAALRYTNKLRAMQPIAYWPQAETGGTVALDESANGRNGAYTGVTLAQPGIGDGRYAPTFDGATSYNNVYSASLAGAFNGQLGSFVAWAKVSAAGVWTDGINRRIILFQVDTNNRVGLNKAVANNEIDYLYVAGATSKTGGITSFSPVGWFHVGVTWSLAADSVKLYINGAQSGATATGLGTFAGALSSSQTIIGSLSTAAAQVWSGPLAHVAVFARVVSAAEMASLAVAA